VSIGMITFEMLMLFMYPRRWTQARCYAYIQTNIKNLQNCHLDEKVPFLQACFGLSTWPLLLSLCKPQVSTTSSDVNLWGKSKGRLSLLVRLLLKRENAKEDYWYIAVTYKPSGEKTWQSNCPCN